MIKKIAVLILLSVFSCGNRQPRNIMDQLSRLTEVKTSSQAILILGITPDKPDANAGLYYKENDIWKVYIKDISCVAGKNGFAVANQKKEGDAKSPTGIFNLSLAFGYAASCETKMPYKQSTSEDFWIDDPGSPQYNTWVHGKYNAKSAEKMLRNDILYKRGLAVDYNTNPIIPGKGSAIFLHVWRKPGSFTSGCVAFSEEDILCILKWLDPAKKPLVVMGMSEELKKLVK